MSHPVEPWVDPDPLHGRFITVESYREKGLFCLAWVMPIQRLHHLDPFLMRFLKGVPGDRTLRQTQAYELNQQILDVGGPLIEEGRVQEFLHPAEGNTAEESRNVMTEEILKRTWDLFQGEKEDERSDRYLGAVDMACTALCPAGYPTLTVDREPRICALEHEAILWAISNDRTPARTMAPWLAYNYARPATRG